MKFLLWQFSAYAAAAVVLGVLVGVLALGPSRARMLRELRKARAEAVAARAHLEELAIQVAHHDATRSLLGTVTGELRVAHESIILIEAEMRANDLLRAHAEHTITSLDDRIMGQRPIVHRASAAEHSVQELRGQFEELRDVRHQERLETSKLLAESESRAMHAEAGLRDLRLRHADSLRSGQTALTEALVRAERAEGRVADAERRNAELVRAQLAMADLVRAERQQGAGASNWQWREPVGAAYDASGAVIDLRAEDRTVASEASTLASSASDGGAHVTRLRGASETVAVGDSNVDAVIDIREAL